jgi:hypothetical protein
MISRKYGEKELFFNPLSFTAIEKLESLLGYGLYRFISNLQILSIKEIQVAVQCFAEAGGNPLTTIDLQKIFNDKGVQFLADIVNDSIIQILNGQPKVKTRGQKKKITSKTKAL